MEVTETHVTLTIEEYGEMVNKTEELVTDFKMIKGIILKLLIDIGITKPDGTQRQTLNMSMLTGILNKAMFNSKQLAEDMHYLKELLPLIEKYQDL